jgi:catechol 2,3-dioxygenase-like lactoylglutathione lyase family enzyme
LLIIEPMTIQRMDHVGVVVDDLAAANRVLRRARARAAGRGVELERYEDSYGLCYVRGPEGIIVELAERIG